jgi:predicted Zn-dependent protease
MLDDVAKALKDDARFSAWQVTEVRGRSHQRYAVFGDVETRREVEKHTTEVRVHVEHEGETDHENFALQGESSFVLSGDGGDIPRELDAAYERARLVKNRAWSLPGTDDGAATAVETTDSRVVEAPAEAVEELGTRMAQAAGKHAGIELASSEAFADYTRVHLVNSAGLDLDREETSLYSEYVLLAKSEASDEVEVYSAPTARRLGELDVEREIDDDVQATFDAMRAHLPATCEADVVIGGSGTEEIFDAFLAHACGPAAFEEWSRMHLEAPVFAELEGEPLTLTSDATLAGGRGSYAFDAVGLPGKQNVLIDKGRFVRRLNDQKHACWLKETATGAAGNLVVASGARTEAELLEPGSRPLFHLLRFSQLTPHPHTGSFSGEIRLGYRIESDGTRTPIKGGSVSGVVFDAFSRAHYSKERAVHGRTHSPRCVRLDRVQVTGE